MTATDQARATDARPRAPSDLVVAAFVMTLSSAFGQTYFIGVFAPSLAPGLIGVLLDLGVRLESQYLAMVAYTLAAALWLTLLVPRLFRLAKA